MLNISIVLYKPNWEEVDALCQQLINAASVRKVYLIDNSPFATEKECTEKIEYRWMNGENLGYGRAHNIALRESIFDNVPLHLVINSDVMIQSKDLDYLCAFMEHNTQVGSVMPKVVYPNGELQYLCKLLPTPLDVFGRRFLPKRWMKHRTEQYELRNTGYDKMMNIPYLSGCFMLLRTKAAHQAHLFDERYFMYPEDIDLTRTIHRNWLTVYLPDITIVHNHARGSYHNGRLLWVHIVNMCRYFNKWGWLFDKERQIMNKIVLDSYCR